MRTDTEPQLLTVRLKNGPAKTAGHPAEDVLDPLFYEAGEWIDRACALLPLVPRAQGTRLAKEVSELLSQQPPQADEEGNQRLASYIQAYQKVSEMPAKQLVDLALEHLDGTPLQQLLVEELCSRVYPNWPDDAAGPLPRPCRHDDPSWCTAECERWRQRIRGSVTENPFDAAAIMGVPGEKRISMSFETLEQYEAALAYLDMADKP